MRYAAVTIAYNEHRNIAAHLRQYPSWVEKILVLASTKPWFGPSAPDECRTWDAIDSLKDPRVETVRMYWPKEHLQRTWGLAALKDYDWVFTLDPDEFLTPEDWETVKKAKDSADRDDSVAIPDEMVTYWKDFSHCWDEEGETHRPVIAVKPKRTVFWEKRETVEETRRRLQVKLHHLSWVKSDEEVWQKINNYSHAVDFDLKDWFENVWRKWEPDSFGLMPLRFPKDVKAKEGELPEPIKRLFQ